MTDDQMRRGPEIIQRPGKFEGEPKYVEYYWNEALEGAEDDTIYDRGPISVFYLSSVAQGDMGLEDDEDTLLIWEDDQGFVWHRIMQRSEYSALVVNAVR